MTTDLHHQAMALFTKLRHANTNNVSHARDVIYDYNEKRRAITAELKPIFAEMDTRMKNGEAVGGCTSLKDYCKAFREFGCVTYARVRQILTGTTGNEGKVKSLELLKQLLTAYSTQPTTARLDRGGCGDAVYRHPYGAPSPRETCPWLRSSPSKSPAGSRLRSWAN
jgi:hypothetical protein